MWHRIQFSTGLTNTVTIRDQWTVRCHPTAKKHFEVFQDDPVQSAELDAFLQNCPPGIQLLDIGAHYGFFAAAAIRFGGPAARVLCIEASPKAAKILQTTIALNQLEHCVQSINVAMGPEDGLLPMLTTGPLAGDYFVVPAETRADVTMVPQRSLASIIQETGFSPTHIKFDIEGFEYEVIEAAIQTLQQHHPIIFLELHGDALHARGKNPGDVLQMLQNAGYNHFLLNDSEITEKDLHHLGFNCRLICS
ncbi:FkbM family methyltransferase [Phragmitibacter flavus]|uniref:FkbM family methyltransferase n=1 Tax=Phragmitibacter flavus TaxID=2576071 RepID=UPI00140DC124|nr:FkbM family methyltransferase [Phragmitibacter flavus]